MVDRTPFKLTAITFPFSPSGERGGRRATRARAAGSGRPALGRIQVELPLPLPRSGRGCLGGGHTSSAARRPPEGARISGDRHNEIRLLRGRAPTHTSSCPSSSPLIWSTVAPSCPPCSYFNFFEPCTYFYWHHSC